MDNQEQKLSGAKPNEMEQNVAPGNEKLLREMEWSGLEGNDMEWKAGSGYEEEWSGGK